MSNVIINNFDDLMEHVKSIESKTVAIASANDDAALHAAIEAKKMKVADSILVGDAVEIESKLQGFGMKKPFPFKIVDEKDNRKTVEIAISFIRDKKADILLKGKVDTVNLMKIVLNKEIGLRTGKVLSDAFVFQFDEKQSDNKFIIISDGGLNLLPDIGQKIKIIKNAVEVAHAFGNPLPKVALLSAMETVNPELPSTMDAAIISKMNERGQIKGCVIDGPLALDNAISPEAVKEKGIRSHVAGYADIIITHSIEAANALAKATTYFAKLRLGHVVMGAKAPILIPSRSDTADAKLLSICIGVMVCNNTNIYK
jgi:phosphate butyryltransferase